MRAGAFLVQQLNADISLMIVMEHVSEDTYWEDKMSLGQVGERVNETDNLKRGLM